MKTTHLVFAVSILCLDPSCAAPEGSGEPPGSQGEIEANMSVPESAFSAGRSGIVDEPSAAGIKQHILESTSCYCSGNGPGGIPLTAACGHSACGSDMYM
jgi:hypothetical protein